MVKIAIAGGAGNVGQEIIDALVARNKHEIIILSRKDAPATELAPGVKWATTSYDDVDQLAGILQGVHTVLSFIANSQDPNATAQKKLIDASVKAGVKRFAPSEWATSGLKHAFWYAFKEETRKYLAELNKDKKVLEYCLFQPGIFTNYMTFPYNSSKHVDLFEVPINFHQRRAIIVEGGEDDVITVTTAQDLAKVVALAVEYEGEWPLVGGIRGANITVSELIKLGEKIRGKSTRPSVEKLNAEDLKAGVIKSSWMPIVTHPDVPPESREALAGSLLAGILLGGFHAGNFLVSDEWNKLLPDYKFTQPEEFLTEAWKAIEAGAKTVFTDY
ncbi:NmrA domain-containing protein [Fusarium keratoplasticum]|uniref:NmrA domain-containing protein n=1 Tax=Fusarium keratoplasticum TaxID=1328300 RepID=A0ACC0RC06_9HYPO|nr:NmrA domain-containing protein [Fusarium keratoplasticum]KAI8680328.1 NmrA domain-containing protein [Fusarium keratoplasticum]